MASFADAGVTQVVEGGVANVMSPLLQWPLRQWQLFCLALAFFSRIPVPASTPYSPELLIESSRYLSLVGLFSGALQVFVVLLLAAQLLPFSIAVLLSLIQVWC